MKFSFGNAPLCGVQPDQFWKMTPYAFGIIARARNKKLADDFDVIKYQTWHVAAFMRMKRMPEFKKYIGPLIDTNESGINEADIKTALKAYQNGKGSKS